MKLCTSTRRQSGTSLIEAVASLSLVAMLTSGAIYISAESSKAQAELQLQELTISQLRSALISNGHQGVDICSTMPTVKLPNNVVLSAPDVQIQGCGSQITATIDGEVITLPEPLRLSANHESIGGRIVVGGTWTNSQ